MVLCLLDPRLSAADVVREQQKSGGEEGPCTRQTWWAFWIWNHNYWFSNTRRNTTTAHLYVGKKQHFTVISVVCFSYRDDNSILPCTSKGKATFILINQKPSNFTVFLHHLQFFWHFCREIYLTRAHSCSWRVQAWVAPKWHTRLIHQYTALTCWKKFPSYFLHYWTLVS